MTTITSGNTVTTAFVVSADTTGNLVLATTGGVINASSSTGGLIIPGGTTAQRPGAVNGMIRYNSNSAAFEVYANNSWATANVTPAPTVVSAPVISGSPVVGNNLTCTTGTWNNNPTGYFYQWLANSVAISANATANVFTLTSTQLGANITCNVTAFNAAGNSIPSTSNSLGPVIAGYFLNRSLRFRRSASTYLNRTPGSAGNRQKFTWSSWMKIGLLASDGFLFNAGTIVNNGTGSQDGILLNADGNIEVSFGYTGSSYSGRVRTTATFRDPSAWYHVVVAVDTTQATAGNRCLIYVNGVSIPYTTLTTITQNFSTQINNTAVHNIGRIVPDGFGGAAWIHFDGYLAEMNHIDGQQLTPSSFGENNTNTGVWQPIAYTGTYGTNGFYLPFTNITSTSTLGNDSSGNGNNWTVNNISLTAGATYDSMTDVPTLTNATTANYCVLNPLNQFAGSGGVVSNGNLRFQSPSGVVVGQRVGGTIAVTSGKWYYETTLTTIHSSLYLQATVGWAEVNTSSSGSSTFCIVDAYTTTSLQGGSDIQKNGTNVQTNLATFTSGDVIGVAFDADNLTITFYKNGSAYGTQVTGLTATTYMPQLTAVSSDGSGNRPVIDANFGQRPFAYTPPTGFIALNTFNLPTPTIGATASTQANKYFDATTYTGDGTSPKSQVNAGGFKPDFVWIKDRSNTNNYFHQLYDSVRGAGNTKNLVSNNTAAENDGNAALFGYLSAFNSNGFQTTNGTSGSLPSAYVNQSGDAYVAWQWQAGQGTTSNNTSGSITTTVSVNASAGFSIIRYAGNNSSGSATLGHGLGVAPAFMIFKNRDQTGDWGVYHKNMTSSNPQNGYLQLNLPNAYGTNSTIWNNTAPTSSVVSIGSYFNGTNINYIGYVWAEVAGFSQFGSYVGNSSTDGTFVYTGFRPRFIMIKSSSAGGASYDWFMVDTARSPSNVISNWLTANSANAESSGTALVDALSNGFKLRINNLTLNNSGTTYIYAAFAESPFKYALAR